MEKDSFWFTHDANSADDYKCMLLIDQLGLEGYGIFWVLVEKLRSEHGYKLPLQIVPSLAKRYNTSTEKVMTTIKNYNLFQIENGEFFYSPSLINRMTVWENSKEARRQRALKGAGERWGKQKMLKQCSSNAQAMQLDAIIREDSIEQDKTGKEKKIERVTEPANIFYKTQLEISNNDEMYKLFIDILYGENKAKMKLKGILSLTEQLDFEQFKEIHGRCKRIDHRLSQYLMKIENGGYFKGKISLYVILDSWVSKDENKESFKPDYSPTFTAIE
jgi:hypothetical protein